MRNFIIYIIFSFALLSFSFLSTNENEKEFLTPYVFEYDTLRFHEPNIEENNPLTIEGITLGRLLFYDPILSIDSSISCGSCHKQAFSFSDGGNVYSKGVKGKEGKRNTMALINLAWQTDFFWDGRAKTLEEVSFFPITDTLEMANDTNNIVHSINNHFHYPGLFFKAFPNEKITFNNVSKAIAQFLRTIHIKGYNNRFFEMINRINDNRQSKILEKEKSMDGLYYRTINTCGRCHPGEGVGVTRFADNLNSNNELFSRFSVTKDSTDVNKFKIPSLINIKLTAPYMHDGKFLTIEEVVKHYETHLEDVYHKNPEFFQSVSIDDLKLLDYDKKKFAAFFELFTDSNIVTSKEYSNPFLSKSFNWNDFPNFK